MLFLYSLSAIVFCQSRVKEYDDVHYDGSIDLI